MNYIIQNNSNVSEDSDLFQIIMLFITQSIMKFKPQDTTHYIHINLINIDFTFCIWWDKKDEVYYQTTINIIRKEEYEYIRNRQSNNTKEINKKQR
jgi:hypothetical protein